MMSEGIQRMDPSGPVAGTSNLEAALSNLQETVSILMDNLDRHNKRLEPILNDFPQPSSEGDGDSSTLVDRAPYSTVVNYIQSEIERIRIVSNRLNSLTYRLDV